MRQIIPWLILLAIAIIIGILIAQLPSPGPISPISPISPTSPIPTPSLPVEILHIIKSVDGTLLACGNVRPSHWIRRSSCQGQRSPFVMGDIIIQCYADCMVDGWLVHGCNTNNGLSFVTVCRPLNVYYLPVIFKYKWK